MQTPKISKAFVQQMTEEITKIHKEIIILSGGHHGIRDNGGLYNSIHKSLLYCYAHKHRPASIGAYVYAEMSRKHHFLDGNKRIAHVFAKMLMRIADHHFKPPEDAADFIVKIAKHQSEVMFEQIEQWISPCLKEVPSES